MKDLRGIFPALLTPFTPSGEVNYDVLRKMVEHLLAQKMDGFYVCGSTGECLLLTVEERKKILETVVQQTAGRGVVIAHTGSIGTGLTLELCHHAKQAGADAVSAVTPFYYKFSPDEVVGFYNDIANQSGMPTIVYNFPGLTGYALSRQNVDALAKNKNIAGIKYTSLDLYSMERFKHLHPELVIYNGHDEVMLYGLTAGADGGIGSTYNFMPGKIRGIAELFAAGKTAEAQAVQHEANDLIDVVAKYGIAGTKEFMRLQGFDCGDCRAPFQPLTDSARAEIKAAHQAAGL